ncbi:MAG: hypothetical protein C3F08_08175 [Candidatus Methylomirabilota bacterium]|nr:MAG: hypothetical protein C3F08_08175 [candidate division NC10 bacterium]
MDVVSPDSELLLAKGADVNACNKDGATALMRAASHGRSGVVDLLLNKGAEVNVKASDGGTALKYALWHGHTNVAELLEKHGARED